MSGSGSREGFGSPPWDPADPVPQRDDTQVLPGLGAPGQHKQSGNGSGPAPGQGPEADGVTRTSQVDDGAADETADHTEDGEGTREPRRPRSHRRRRRRRNLLHELPVLIVVALVLALVIKTYAIQAFFIPSSSMENTLDIGDRVLINKLVYDFRGIHRGDIIVFDGNGSWDFNPPASSNLFSRFFDDVEGIVGISHDSDIYIKRVIGLPGDHVACCDSQGRVTVNGVPLTEGTYVYPGEAPSVQ